jgi:hypothetical protein
MNIQHYLPGLIILGQLDFSNSFELQHPGYKYIFSKVHNNNMNVKDLAI